MSRNACQFCLFPSGAGGNERLFRLGGSYLTLYDLYNLRMPAELVASAGGENVRAIDARTGKYIPNFSVDLREALPDGAIVPDPFL